MSIGCQVHGKEISATKAGAQGTAKNAWKSFPVGRHPGHWWGACIWTATRGDKTVPAGEPLRHILRGTPLIAVDNWFPDLTNRFQHQLCAS